MNVLHISESDRGGGAALVAYKLHRELLGRRHVSRMLVGRKLTPDAETRSLKRHAGWRAADRACGELLDRLGLQYALYPSSFALVSDPWFREADVVQLHNLHGSYFAFTALPLLGRRRPLVWLLEDDWAYTGHVAYALECERWRTGCGACPHLREYPRLRRDTTALLWRLKRSVYARTPRLTLVVASRWSEGRVRTSPLLRRFPVHRIPHGVDTDLFAPGPREEARARVGLPMERPVVLFVASDLRERRKGLHLLEEALRLLERPPLLVTAGSGAVAPGIEHRALGPLEGERLADAYRAADVFAVPTLADVQTQTAPESLACGTPCVSFDAGGVTDVVRDGETGLHARFADARSFAQALDRLLRDDELREHLSVRARAAAAAEFSLRLQADRYERLYEETLAA